VFVRAPAAGRVKTRLTPPLSPQQANDLYLAFLVDLCGRLRDSTKYRPTIFLAGARVPQLDEVLDPRWPVVAQAEGHLGDRLRAAFDLLLREPGERAVVIGSDSPDLPLAYLKRAFMLLKHRDVVIGPAVDGGYYLIGLRRPAPSLFEGNHWGTELVLDKTLDAVERDNLTLGLLAPWYDVDDDASLHFFASLNRARRIAGANRLRASERALDALPPTRE
jgi:hypothetical protein